MKNFIRQFKGYMAYVKTNRSYYNYNNDKKVLLPVFLSVYFSILFSIPGAIVALAKIKLSKILSM